MSFFKKSLVIMAIISTFSAFGQIFEECQICFRGRSISGGSRMCFEARPGQGGFTAPFQGYDDGNPVVLSSVSVIQGGFCSQCRAFAYTGPNFTGYSREVSLFSEGGFGFCAKSVLINCARNNNPEEEEEEEEEGFEIN
jgi:hypothetical protein